MRLINLEIHHLVIETHKLKIGTFYFLDNIVIAEINEGVHLDFKSSEDFFKAAHAFFGTTKPFGYISNRINKFSVSPVDFANYSLKLENIKSFCAITYNNYYDNMNIEIEKRFYTKPFYSTTTINDAIDWTRNVLNNTNKATA